MTGETTSYTNLEIKHLDGSEIEITAELPAEHFSTYRSKALKQLGANVKIDGFRPGHVPEHILESHIGEGALMDEAAQLALADVYPAIVMNQKLNIIGRPQITLTKVAKDNPLGFKITTTVFPVFTLPDYKTIAEKEMSKKEDIEVSEKEVDTIVLDIQKTRVLSELKQKDPKTTKTLKDINDKEVIPLTDEDAKTFGGFETVVDFKKQIKENLGKEKQNREREKKRVQMSEKLISETSISVPKILIESELEKMMAQFKDDIARMGLKFEEYLKKIDKTEEKLREEWKSSAEKRAKLQLIVNKIAQEEKIVPNKDKTEETVKHLLEQHKDADPGSVRIYVESMAVNEMVFVFLEECGGEKKEPAKT